MRTRIGKEQEEGYNNRFLENGQKVDSPEGVQSATGVERSIMEQGFKLRRKIREMQFG